MKKVLLSLLFIIVVVTLYGFFIAPKKLQVVENSIKVSNLTESFNDFKIVQFSDLLLGSTKNIEDLDEIVTSINELQPDIIVFTGDLISTNYVPNEKDIKTIKEKLNNLDCTLYKYAIIGDNDQKNMDLYEDILKSSDFKILDNSSTYLFYKNATPIKLTGITDISKIDDALYIEEEIETTYNIVFTHYPDYIDTISNYNVDLVLAGHSLKGQVRIPFIGGIVRKNNAQKYIDDYYQVNNTKMYISSGLGCEYINMRFLNKPEINLYRLIKIVTN